MKTLDQIVAAVRSGEAVDHNELRLAVAAFDVLLAQLDLASDYKQLQQYFIAADAVPRDYLGEANDPDDPASVAWYKAMHNAGAEPVTVTVVTEGCGGRNTLTPEYPGYLTEE